MLSIQQDAATCRHDEVPGIPAGATLHARWVAMVDEALCLPAGAPLHARMGRDVSECQSRHINERKHLKIASACRSCGLLAATKTSVIGALVACGFSTRGVVEAGYRSSYRSVTVAGTSSLLVKYCAVGQLYPWPLGGCVACLTLRTRRKK